MNIQRWLARRQPSWVELDGLLKKAEKQGLKALDANEIRQLASLYRSTAADLARARTHIAGDLIVQDLQTLATRAIPRSIKGHAVKNGRPLGRFTAGAFPPLCSSHAATLRWRQAYSRSQP